MINGFASHDVLPSIMIMMGRFAKNVNAIGHQDSQKSYLEGFQKLSVMLNRHLRLLYECEFLFLPDYHDPTFTSSILPMTPLLDVCSAKIRAMIPNAHFSTNPCRIRYGFQSDILLFRYDLVKKFGTHTLFPFPKDRDDLRELVVHTILSQTTLIPFSMQQQPVFHTKDSALRLLPPPSLIVIGDKTRQYAHVVDNVSVVNPGSFSDSSGTFILFYPRSGECELSSL
jgi:DNA polymerase epsilon subunit 2